MIVLVVLLLQLLNIRLLLAICLTNCSTINIEYPFGTDINCDALQGFELTCNQSYQPPKLFLANSSVEVLNISYLNSTALVRSKVVSTNQSNYSESWSLFPPNGPYTMSTTKNKFVATGCGTLAQLSSPDQQPQQVISACVSVCVSEASTPINGSCTGIGCCKSSIPISNNSFEFQLTSVNQMTPSATKFSNKAFIVEETWLNGEGWYTNLTDDQSVAVPVLLDWKINGSSCSIAQGMSNYQCQSENSYCVNYTSGTGYQCKCSNGYDGNPYKKNGCQDINECNQKDIYPCYGVCDNTQGSYNCFCEHGNNSSDPKKEECVSSDGQDFIPLSGVLIIVGVGIFVCLLSLPIAVIMLLYKLKARRLRKLKEKFFKENRGFLLEQLISSNKDIAERMKIFNLEELEKATNNFDQTRIVGHGGHGTVYKGILSDQRVVAIKKSKIRLQKEIEEFINEVIILSQINHRNVVKLYGCCLETEVPLLVYEFISNGDLSKHLHGERHRSLPWQDRMRIALETARALAYLHTAASISVFHRDIKTPNILLDESLTAKLSDFGASRSVPINQTGITTVIQGTYGYVDPEYYYTGRLTEKSDVYSFGVILVELLTREMPTSQTRFPEGGNLATNFMMLMREKRLLEILDHQVVVEGRKSEIKAFAALAEACLSIQGEERPTMKQVEMKLENLTGLRKRSKKRSGHLSTPPRWDENEELLRLISMEGGGSSSEYMTRQFSLEEEYLVESTPR
ncbi:wall-associated receptor kinase 5-like [Carex rostrata]